MWRKAKQAYERIKVGYVGNILSPFEVYSCYSETSQLSCEIAREESAFQVQVGGRGKGSPTSGILNQGVPQGRE